MVFELVKATATTPCCSRTRAVEPGVEEGECCKAAIRMLRSEFPAGQTKRVYFCQRLFYFSF